MNTELDLLESVIKRKNLNFLTLFLKSCEDSRLFYQNSSNMKGVVSTMNSLMNDVKPEGLLILNSVLPQCATNIISDNISSWIQVCIRYISRTNKSEATDLAFNLLGKLLELSTKYPSVRKDTAQNVIPKIMELFISQSFRTSNNKLTVLACLESVFVHYGKSCGTSKESVENFLFQLLECSEDTIYMAAKCYLLLASCGSPGSNSDHYVSAWRNQQKELVNILHLLLNELFEGISEIEGTYQKYISSTSGKLPAVEDNSPLIKKMKLTSQFKAVGEFLRVMLLDTFPTNKKVLPELILSVVCRTLAVNAKMLKANISNDSLNLCTQISNLHMTSINILNAMILSCKMSLLTFGPIICKLLTQTLNWTNVEDWTYGQEKPYSSLRVCAYECLISWLSVTRSCSGIDKFADDIIGAVLSDIHMKKPSVLLNIQTKHLKGKQGKRQRTKQAMNNVMEKSEFLTNSLANNKLCGMALMVIPALLESANTFLSLNHHKEIQMKILKEVSTLQFANLEDLPFPYSVEDCRLNLYAALLSVCCNPHPEFPPPISSSVDIFSSGLNDSSLKVVRFCRLAQSSLEKILRPVAPTLDYLRTEVRDHSLNLSPHIHNGTFDFEQGSPQTKRLKIDIHNSTDILHVHSNSDVSKDVETDEFNVNHDSIDLDVPTNLDKGFTGGNGPIMSNSDHCHEGATSASPTVIVEDDSSCEEKNSPPSSPDSPMSVEELCDSIEDVESENPLDDENNKLTAELRSSPEDVPDLKTHEKIEMSDSEVKNTNETIVESQMSILEQEMLDSFVNKID